MTLLEKNKTVLGEFIYYCPDAFKEVSISGDDMVYNGNKISLNKVDVYEIVNSNEKLKNDLSKMSTDQIFDILKLNESLASQSLKTNFADVFEHNNKVVQQLKENNTLMKNISVVNRNRDMSREQFFNIIDSNGNVHIFKNDRGLDISRIYEEFITTNKEDNLNAFISLMDRKLPLVSLNKAMDMEESYVVSQDFENKLNEVKEEFEGRLGIAVYGNEKEDMIVVVNKTNPEENEVRTYKRDERNNLVTEKHTNEIDNNKASLKETEKTPEQEKEQGVDKENNLDENENIDEEVSNLIPYEEFKNLINSDIPLNDEQKQNVKLWEQTLGDIYVYEDYLSSDIVKYLDDYRRTMEGFQINQNIGTINKNQQEALETFYEMTNPTFKDAKLGNLSEERKEGMQRKLLLETANKDGKATLAIVLGISLLTLTIIIGFILYMTK